MAGLDGEVEKAGLGVDDNEKSKGRERSGTKSSTKEGKKGVFGFMTGEFGSDGSAVKPGY
jgi:hypothetical protein